MKGVERLLRLSMGSLGGLIESKQSLIPHTLNVFTMYELMKSLHPISSTMRRHTAEDAIKMNESE